jgi:hypothetical protein
MNYEEEHIIDENEQDCWCKPEMVFEFEGRELWVHHGPGEELPPADVIAQAIADIIADKDD